MDAADSRQQKKEIAPAVALVKAALTQLAQEDKDLAESVTKALYVYARRTYDKNPALSVEDILAIARQGLSHIESITPDTDSTAPQQKTLAEVYAHIKNTQLSRRLQERNPIIAAAAAGDLDAVRASHKDTRVMNSWGEDAIRLASENGHLAVVKYLYKNGAGFWVNTAFESASENGHLAVVKYLRKKRADIRANTAFELASKNGHLAVVKYLHKKGADIQTNNNAAIIGASENGHLAVVKYLHKNGADIKADCHATIRLASENGHLSVVEYLHQNGASIRMKFDEAMVSASYGGHLAVVKYLHQNGINMQDKLDSSIKELKHSIQSASNKGYLAVVEYLHEQAGVPLQAPIEPSRQALTAYKRACILWQKTARCDPPPGLEDFDPRHFRPKLFEAILPFLETEGYKGKQGHELAAPAAGLFGNEDRLARYIERWGVADKQQPLHDLIQIIRLPSDGNPNLKDWADAVLQQGPEMAKLVKFSGKLPSPIKSQDGKGWSLAETRAACALFAFNKAAEHPKLAALCMELKLDEEDFDKALKLVQKGTPSQKRIPEITLAGDSFDMPGATFRRLAPDDIRGLFLGELTDCCQSIGSQGADCAKHGYTSENGGFYVVEDKTGKIIAQTWAWRGEKDEMCFDTLETLGSRVTDQQWKKILKGFADQLTKQKTDITCLTVGMGGDTPKSLTRQFKQTKTPATPKAYKGYTEASQQIQVWTKDNKALSA